MYHVGLDIHAKHIFSGLVRNSSAAVLASWTRRLVQRTWEDRPVKPFAFSLRSGITLLTPRYFSSPNSLLVVRIL